MAAMATHSDTDFQSQPELLRIEDARMLRGQGGFVANQVLPQMAHAVFVRSPHAHAHAQILDIQIEDARAQPGVLAVLVPADFAALGQPKVNALLPEMRLPNAALLPPDRVLAVGAPVVLVLAETLHEAQAAADLVWIEYQDLPVVADFDATAAPLYPQMAAGNRALHCEVKTGAMPDGPAAASVQLELPRVAASPLEPRAALMQWHADEQGLRAWLSTQTPSRAREDLAAALGLAQEQVRVVATDVGGAFGGKASVFAEDLMLALAACRPELQGRPLRWLASRGEDLLAGTHGRASKLRGQLWVDATGRIEALDADLQFALGHWLPFSVAAPLRNTSRILPGPYRVTALRLQAEGWISNAAAVGIYRGAGRPEACILMERLVDEAARARGLDPLDLRLANVWAADELPRTLPSGVWLDRCDPRALLERAAELFDYRARRQRQHAAVAAGKLVGLGIALYVEPCGQGGESARLTALSDGDYVLATGSTAQGQGRETAFARIAAQALGCAPEAITALHGDTARCPAGIGALASRSTAIGGSAILGAVEQLQQRLREGAALPCTVELFHQAANEAWASGCVMLELEIVRETGTLNIGELVWVDDAGVIVHPELVRGQLIGGLAQGLGQALMEQIVYDDNGQLLTGSLMDYALPRAEDMPLNVRIDSLPTRSAANTLGAKGVGEAGCIGIPAALLNAAHDSLGVRQLDFPLTPARLWRAMQKASH